MRSTVKKGIAAIGTFAVGAGIMLAGSLAPAQASHYNGTQLCSNGDEGRSYTHVFNLPIKNDLDNQIGRVSVNKHRKADGTWRYCAVTIRENHNTSTWTVARIRRGPDGEWHRKARDTNKFAGPVYACRCGNWVEGRGQISGHFSDDFML